MTQPTTLGMMLIRLVLEEYVKTMGYDGQEYIEELMSDITSSKQEMVWAKAVVADMLHHKGYVDEFIARQLGMERSSMSYYRLYYTQPTFLPKIMTMSMNLEKMWNGHTEAVEALSAA